MMRVNNEWVKDRSGTYHSTSKNTKLKKLILRNDPNGDSAVLVYSRKGCYQNVTDALVTHGLDPNIPDTSDDAVNLFKLPFTSENELEKILLALASVESSVVKLLKLQDNQQQKNQNNFPFFTKPAIGKTVENISCGQRKNFT